LHDQVGCQDLDGEIGNSLPLSGIFTHKLRLSRIEIDMAKMEKFSSKAAMAKHENAEGKAIAALEKKRGEKDVVVKTKASMKSKSAGKKINKTV